VWRRMTLKSITDYSRQSTADCITSIGQQ
jgi:hypothetical protein